MNSYDALVNKFDFNPDDEIYQKINASSNLDENKYKNRVTTSDLRLQ